MRTWFKSANDCFKNLDRNGDGYITYLEFERIFIVNNLNVSHNKLKSLFTKLAVSNKSRFLDVTSMNHFFYKDVARERAEQEKSVVMFEGRENTFATVLKRINVFTNEIKLKRKVEKNWPNLLQSALVVHQATHADQPVEERSFLNLHYIER